MIAALPLMLLYNGEKEPKLNQSIFYIFYPLHIAVLYTIGSALRRHACVTNACPQSA